MLSTIEPLTSVTISRLPWSAWLSQKAFPGANVILEASDVNCPSGPSQASLAMPQAIGKWAHIHCPGVVIVDTSPVHLILFPLSNVDIPILPELDTKSMSNVVSVGSFVLFFPSEDGDALAVANQEL